jgi:hypothetical protein
MTVSHTLGLRFTVETHDDVDWYVCRVSQPGQDPAAFELGRVPATIADTPLEDQFVRLMTACLEHFIKGMGGTVTKVRDETHADQG